MTPPDSSDRDQDPDIDRWTTEGGAHAGPAGKVTTPEVLEVLDFLAAHVLGRPIASDLAARLAAAIRVRGLHP
jgi:hypothetical protein